MSCNYRFPFIYDRDTTNNDLFDLMSRRIQLQHSLSSQRYHPPLSYSTFTTRYSPSPFLSQSVEFPRLTFEQYRPSLRINRFEWSQLNTFNRQPSFFPLAEYSYRYQKDYHRQRLSEYSFKRRWKSIVYVLIFYFYLKRNLQRAKKKSTYYQRDYHRLRFLELLTGIHRIYLEPHSTIYQCLSSIVHSSSPNLYQCVEIIYDQITHFHPQFGILGTSSEESVLIYLLQCSLEQYPKSYFWSIERHLLSLSYTKMKEYHHDHLDHFTTKFLVISTFIFRGLTKTLLLKPVKYRLTRGQLSSTQWTNTRLCSSLILSIARHAIMHKSDVSRLPMPFPFEMKSYLFDDDQLQERFSHLETFIDRIVPKLSSWACDYAERLQGYILRTTKKEKTLQRRRFT